ncbi:kinase-like protein [Gigaspora margarita]|uniref:Kinase-like protein n=1 Tax=Gigaspora margarita TaxID=4874 RepID=A0A8H4A414_GIGMA|nr:kinase-like protein [Gigaspora margarita]
MINTLKYQEELLEKAVFDGHINYIEFKKFTIPKKIDIRSYVTVYKYEWKDCELTVALKRIEVDKDLNKNIVDDFVSEHSKNILIHQGHPKIADFGLSKQINEMSLTSKSALHGMPAYIEPKCFTNSIYKQCWDDEPDNRPKMSEILKMLNQFISGEDLSQFITNEPLIENSKSSSLNHITPSVSLDLSEINIEISEPINTGGAYIEISEPINTDGDIAIIKFLQNTSLQWIPFNDLQIIKEIGKVEESGTIHPQAVYTSRFISLKELVTINSQAVCTNEIINDDNKIIESQENNKIIESQEDNIPIERMNKFMLEIEKNGKLVVV